ncbi:MAG: hypothetical protein A3G25_08370 [Betaproteobacteria bacterium RIFCSPLOWO2_12_FULL_63_13]|nr:MAG: hypothetical protein A3H32_18130 [Betaproteobacteria bacterium RIFCSPLOWO2_02_FULL_63_19]OGA43350.1 MAG: hypothetical protein A3G25_08370 [Betaproteobacteria bacterium RIFCSPLOWO2_12_FULL_63_13]
MGSLEHMRDTGQNLDAASGIVQVDRMNAAFYGQIQYPGTFAQSAKFLVTRNDDAIDGEVSLF